MMKIVALNLLTMKIILFMEQHLNNMIITIYSKSNFTNYKQFRKKSIKQNKFNLPKIRSKNIFNFLLINKN